VDPTELAYFTNFVPYMADGGRFARAVANHGRSPRMSSWPVIFEDSSGDLRRYTQTTIVMTSFSTPQQAIECSLASEAGELDKGIVLFTLAATVSQSFQGKGQ
jgi:hypothetical protein